MAFTIEHKIVAHNYSEATVGALHAYMVANPGRFTIIEASNPSNSGGWFVFELAGGTGWQCWIGGYRSSWSEPAWAAGNTLAGSVNWWSVNYALSPAGGWNAGVDTPTAGMFSNSPLGGTWWNKIRPWSTDHFTDRSDWLTVWDDPAEGSFIILGDGAQANVWDEGLLLCHVDSRMTALEDPYPVIGLAGIPEFGDSGDWLRITSGSTWSAILLPGSAVQGTVVMEPGRTLNANTQPNPVSGKYDLPAIAIYCNTAGIRHNRGTLNAATIRQIDGTRNARMEYGSGVGWMTPRNGADFVLPWNIGTAF